MKTNLFKIVWVCSLIMLSATVALGKKTHLRTNNVYLMFGGGTEKVVSAKFELCDPGVIVSKGQPCDNKKIDVECISDDKGKGHIKLTLKAGRHQTGEVAKQFRALKTAVWLSANHYNRGSQELPSEMNFFFTGILTLEVSFLDGRKNIIRKVPLTFAQFPQKDLVGITINNTWIVASKVGRMDQLGKYESICVPVESTESASTDTGNLIISQHQKYYKGKYFYASWDLASVQDPTDEALPDDKDDQDDQELPDKQ